MNRKDQHIKYALMHDNSENSFDDLFLIHQALPKYNLDDIDISTQICGIKLSSPFFINAMTGGSEQAKQINRQLAEIAKACDLLLFTGSYSPALKDKKYIDSYRVIRDIAPDIKLGVNLGLDKNYQDVTKAIIDLKADIIQLHLNLAQELIMPEGDINVKVWRENLYEIVNKINIPIIIKETGCGISKEVISELINLKVNTVDISGMGGTDFSWIENQRRQKPISYLNQWGIPTVISLLEVKPYLNKVDILASGGVRNPLDIVKSLVLGAKAVGLSGIILKQLHQNGLENTISLIKEWQHQCKLIMCLLNCVNINDLLKTHYYLTGKTYAYFQQIITNK